RAAAGATRRIDLHAGTGSDEAWCDGGAAAGLGPSIDEWVHIAFTIGEGHATVYISGDIVSDGDFDGVDWSECDILSIASGAPRFTGWDHLSDLSLYDELRMFDRVLAQDEIQAMMND